MKVILNKKRAISMLENRVPLSFQKCRFRLSTSHASFSSFRFQGSPFKTVFKDSVFSESGLHPHNLRADERGKRIKNVCVFVQKKRGFHAVGVEVRLNCFPPPDQLRTRRLHSLTTDRLSRL